MEGFRINLWVEGVPRVGSSPSFQMDRKQWAYTHVAKRIKLRNFTPGENQSLA